jgi:hypothetical protein
MRTPPAVHSRLQTDNAQLKRLGHRLTYRRCGKSKDHRAGLSQVVIGMAVTRDGIPVRVWYWPGSTHGSALIRQVKDDLRDWTLARIVWVADRGFTSAENRRYRRSGDHHYIIGEKLRSGSAEAGAALSRQGRYQDVTANTAGQGGPHLRLGAVRDLLQPRRSRARRGCPRAHARPATGNVKDSGKLTAAKRAGLRGVISAKPGLNRYLRVTPAASSGFDAARIKAEENLDGKYLPRTTGPRLSAEDIALGYKQLLEIERGAT